MGHEGRGTGRKCREGSRFSDEKVMGGSVLEVEEVIVNEWKPGEVTRNYGKVSRPNKKKESRS